MPHKSFSGKVWRINNDYSDDVAFIMRSKNLGEISARILVNRGIKTIDEAEIFLNSTLRSMIPEPLSLLDMDKAIDRVKNAILQNEKVFVYGDYDVDGITSTFLLVRYLKLIGVKNISYALPNRFEDGYGLTKKTIETVLKNNASLLIVVDSGICSIEEVSFANKHDLDIVILDHHISSDELPDACAVVNPNRYDQNEIGDFHIKNLCAAGVVFLFLIGLRRSLKEIDFFKNVEDYDLKNFIDIVSLGTLCDVMNLTGVNRAFVNFCLKQKSYSIGISSIMNVLRMNKINSPEDLSFYIGPVINAAGRLADASLAMKLFMSESKDESILIAKKLVDLNHKRKEIEKNILDDAIIMIEEKKLYENKHIFVYGDGWNEGVIGIVAGKIKDKYNRPTFVATFNQNGEGKGSVRSVKGVYIDKIFDVAKKTGVLSKCGGHAMAGGFSICKSQVQNFENFLFENINEYDNTHYLDIDYFLPSNIDINEVALEINMLEPFGKSVEKPVFCLEGMHIVCSYKMSNLIHMTVKIKGKFSKLIDLKIFNIDMQNKLVSNLEKNSDNLVDVAVNITKNDKYGVGLILLDAKKHRGG